MVQMMHAGPAPAGSFIHVPGVQASGVFMPKHRWLARFFWHSNWHVGKTFLPSGIGLSFKINPLFSSYSKLSSRICKLASTQAGDLADLHCSFSMHASGKFPPLPPPNLVSKFADGIFTTDFGPLVSSGLVACMQRNRNCEPSAQMMPPLSRNLLRMRRLSGSASTSATSSDWE